MTPRKPAGTKPAAPKTQTNKNARKHKLAEALRQNLLRRKQAHAAPAIVTGKIKKP